MSTLQSQYQEYLIANPDRTMTYEEWLNLVHKLKIESFMSQMGDIKDWDITLLDGLEDE